MDKHNTKLELSVVYIVKNGGALFDTSLASVFRWVDDIVLVDNGSTDNTLAIARNYQVRIFREPAHHEGKLREQALAAVRYPWILVLDHDEVVTPALQSEIQSMLATNPSPTAYRIPFRNHLFGHALHHGGEQYYKLVLFHKDAIELINTSVHARYKAADKTRTKKLHSFIDHYSYQNLWQVIIKFTDYGIRLARERYEKNEPLSLKKLVMYPLHMFWARYIKDKGYRDGLLRIVLDGAFTYMEWLSYMGLLYYKIVHGPYRRHNRHV
ncbi:MAG: glycosyltransferase family 2 protein [Candidatus Roizmanbacteria bacterium]|nr:glycosyltransferase family 2 protein [Candidatus Roizmanbacteria bacterium]